MGEYAVGLTQWRLNSKMPDEITEYDEHDEYRDGCECDLCLTEMPQEKRFARDSKQICDEQGISMEKLMMECFYYYYRSRF